MKILITGCHGQLGTELQKQLADEECALGPLPERLRKATVIAVDVDELDITDREATVTSSRIPSSTALLLPTWMAAKPTAMPLTASTPLARATWHWHAKRSMPA